MRCPACTVEMNELAANAPSSTQTYRVDVCPSCHGLWLDRDEALHVCPTVGLLEQRRLEIEALGQRGGGIATCPRCSAVPFAFVVADIEIDFCTACCGVFLEQREHLGKTRGIGLHRPTGGGGPFRAKEDERQIAEPRCAACREPVVLRNTHMTSQGPFCRHCYATLANARAAKEAAAQRGSIGVDRLIFGVNQGLEQETDWSWLR